MVDTASRDRLQRNLFPRGRSRAKSANRGILRSILNRAVAIRSSR